MVVVLVVVVAQQHIHAHIRPYLHFSHQLFVLNFANQKKICLFGGGIAVVIQRRAAQSRGNQKRLRRAAGILFPVRIELRVFLRELRREGNSLKKHKSNLVDWGASACLLHTWFFAPAQLSSLILPLLFSLCLL